VAPAGLLFTQEGRPPPIEGRREALCVLALLNTPLFRFGLNKLCGQHKSAGYLNIFPYRELAVAGLSVAVEAVVNSANELRAHDETQSIFDCRVVCNTLTLHAQAARLSDSLQNYTSDAARLEQQCEACARASYRASKQDADMLDSFASVQPNIELPLDDLLDASQTLWFVAHSLMSIAVGAVVGRWDIRYAYNAELRPECRNPFEQLPACPPAMLQGQDGSPARETPTDYPLQIDWDGMIVDDAEHQEDIVRQVRAVLDVIWKGVAEAIEAEACETLGVSNLRDYFRKPGAGGFWDDHVKRYSKSRRKAPIYWLLQSSKKNYALWLY
jgi:hypothetical protein